MKTLDTIEAAPFLRLHPDTLRARAKAAGEIKGTKPGKCWVFIEDDLAAWLRPQYSDCKKGEEKPSHSFKRDGIWWVDVTRKADAEYDALLARKTVKPPRNTTTVSRPNFGGKRS